MPEKTAKQLLDDVKAALDYLHRNTSRSPDGSIPLLYEKTYRDALDALDKLREKIKE